MEREVGGGIGMGNTCKPMAVSFQCMKKSTTIKNNNNNYKNKKVKSESEVAQSCLTLCNPMDCSLPGSSVHGILQARVLEWGAIAFSDH